MLGVLKGSFNLSASTNRGNMVLNSLQSGMQWLKLEEDSYILSDICNEFNVLLSQKYIPLQLHVNGLLIMVKGVFVI